MRRTVVLLVALAVAVSGCGALTGRPFIQWSDDKAVQTRVKARLAAVSLKYLGRIHVDVYNGNVYLTGLVDSADAKQRAEAATMAVEGVRQVVSHLIAHHDNDAAPSALPLAVVASTVPAPPAGIARLDGNVAYDGAGHVVATVYTVAMSDLAHAEAERFSAAAPIAHVTIHAMTANARVPTPHYLVVLWHASDSKGAPYTR
jgi:hypothetical protein